MPARTALAIALALALPACRTAWPGPSPSECRMNQNARIDVVELSPGPLLARLPTIPWVAPGDASWREGDPLFAMADEPSGTAARGWAALTNEAILLRIVVTDDVHNSTGPGARIWRGDSVQFAIDAFGDGSGSLPRNTEMVGPDDAFISVARTDRGVAVWAQDRARAERMAAAATDYAAVERDEAAGTTTYDITVPWREFGAEAGVAPAVGMAVIINDRDRARDVTHLYWGDRLSTGIRPALFPRLAVGAPPGELHAGTAIRTSLWRETGAGELRLVTTADGPLRVRVRMGEREKTFAMPAATAAGIRRFSVHLTPGCLPAEPLPVRSELLDAGGSVLVAREGALEAPGLVIERLSRKIDELVASSPHPLFTQHLRSTEALVRADWARSLPSAEENPGPALQTVSYARSILDGLDGDAGKWESYASGERGLVVAFVSGYDTTLQQYSLNLPRDWDPEKAYPLRVYLHGFSNPHPLWFASLPFMPRGGTAAETGPRPEPHFALGPWGRGNTGYRDAGETDVWEAIASVRENFHIDEDRVYLTGHSMGGFGTWAIGVRTPDVWAGLCIYSGGDRHAPAGTGLAGNVAYVPVRLWHGGADPTVTVENAYRLRDELRKYGNDPSVVIAEGVGHMVPREYKDPSTIWLLGHRRRRPDSFTYVADTRRHLGAWGITLRRNPAVDPMPRFECRIDGNTVRIKSTGTEGLTVRLGEDGLGLKGKVTVTWNGEQAYDGPAREIRLGTGGGRARW